MGTSDSSLWWQLYVGLIMSFIAWIFMKEVCLTYGLNDVWSTIWAWGVTVIDVCGFYLLLEAAIMEQEGMSIKQIYQEIFGGKQ